MTETLSLRAINRATLARQHLLSRTRTSALEVIEHLGGMQSQAPLAPYVGLWTRIEGFDPAELSRLTEQREVVRLHVMRNTVHLLSARDALGWRHLFTPLHAAQFSAHFRNGTSGSDHDALVAEALSLLQERPRARAELGRLLGRSRPEAAPDSLAYEATHHIALCQVPPRGVWGAKGGAAAWTPLESWLGAPLGDEPVETLILRYLAAFGPAQVADIQLWSGLTRLQEVVERLPLREFRGPDGQMLYDVPEAPRPPEDEPAPPRFLPEYDNLLLSYKDRTRVNPDGRPVPLPAGNGASSGTFLLGGTWQGTWRIRDRTLIVQPFAVLRGSAREAVLTEAERLGALLAPEAGHAVVIERPQP